MNNKFEFLADGTIAEKMEAMYARIDEGFTCTCGKRVRKNQNFWILSQPMMYPHQDEGGRFKLQFMAMCGDCGQAASNTMKERWENEKEN